MYNHYTLHYDRKRAQKAWQDHLKKGDYNTFITFAFHGVSLARNRMILRDFNHLGGEFQKHLDQYFFGKGFYKIDRYRHDVHRTNFIGFPERINSNFHIHMLASICPVRCAPIHEAVNYALCKTFFNHYKTPLTESEFINRNLVSVDIQPISCDDHKVAVSYYITKDHSKVECYPHLFLPEFIQV